MMGYEELRTKIIEVCRADDTTGPGEPTCLEELIGDRTYNHIPQDTERGYMRVSTEHEDDDTKPTDPAEGSDFYLDSILIFRMFAGKDDRGDLFVDKVANRLRFLFHRKKITLANGEVPILHCQRYNTLPDAGGYTHQGIMSFRAMSYET